MPGNAAEALPLAPLRGWSWLRQTLQPPSPKGPSTQYFGTWVIVVEIMGKYMTIKYLDS